MSTAYLGLGSNEGTRHRHLCAAIEHLCGHGAVRGVNPSPVYETEAHTRTPDAERPPFLNAVLRARVDCAPESLLHVTQAVEREEGRARSGDQTWPPRPLDVDLLAVGTETRRTEALVLPHPRLAERRFVLRPWADLAPNFVVPAPFDQTVQSLLDECEDRTDIRRTPNALGEGLGARSPVDDASS